MKKYIKISLIFAFGVVLTGCKKFLDQQPLSSVSTNKFWKTSDDLNAGVAGIYDGMQDMFNTNYIFWGDGRTDNFDYSNYGNIDYILNGLTASTTGTDWSPIYSTIGRANTAIENIPNVKGVDSKVTNDYLAQAYTARAFCYFYIVRLWGAAPLWTQPYESLDTNPYKSRTSADSIINESIIPDLTKAYALSDFSKKEQVVFNTGSICAILMDVYMYKHDYANALIWYDNLTKLKRYSLESTANWKNNFIAPKSTKEVIFSLDWDYIVDGGNNTSTIIGAGNTNSDFTIDDNIWNYFSTTPQDIRGAQTIDLNVTSHDKILKFYPVNIDPKTGRQLYPNSSQANIYFTFYRLADINLLRAEALIKTGDLNNALTMLNSVHTRAGLPAYKITDFTGADDMFNKVLRERQLELYSEGKRWFDLEATDNVINVMDPVIKQRQIDRNTTPTGFGDPRKVLWPINQNVLNANPALTQNPPY